jgi:hypothetical protein
MSGGVKAEQLRRFRIMVHAFDTQGGQAAFWYWILLSVIRAESELTHRTLG